MPEHDLIIRGGLVVDGTGGEPYVADVAIQGDKIISVGRVAESGVEEIDASGRIVTPGFVDIHTHYDGQVTWEDTLAPSSQHGVTTVLMGNCGVGFAPCRAEDRALLLEVMEGVEDIPEVVMADGIPWNWESFPEYLNALDQRRTDIDFAAQVPHAAMRIHVMGQRGADREPPSKVELAAITQLVAEGVRAGAFGVSTSRSMAHRTAAGVLAPTVTSEEEEYAALARGLAEAGGGVFQLIPGAQEGKDPAEEMAMLRRLVGISGHPLSFSLINTVQHPGATARTLELLADARADGLPISAQVFPRGVGMLFGLDLSFHPFRFHPSYRLIEHLPLTDRVAAMRTPDMRARLLREGIDHPNPTYQYLAGQVGELFALGDPPDYEPRPEDKLGARAARMGLSPEELAYDLLLEQDGHATLMLAAANFVGGTLEPVRAMMEHPGTLIGLGDGGAHYGIICDSSYPTSLLAYWTRDREKGPRLPLPWAVRALSHANAQAVGFSDRGLVRSGMKADLNVIDYDRLRLKAPRVRWDLPAGGRRLIQEAEGYDATIVSGIMTYRHGQATGARPGRLVRRQSV